MFFYRALYISLHFSVLERLTMRLKMMKVTHMQSHRIIKMNRFFLSCEPLLVYQYMVIIINWSVAYRKRFQQGTTNDRRHNPQPSIKPSVLKCSLLRSRQKKTRTYTKLNIMYRFQGYTVRKNKIQTIHRITTKL